MQSSQPVVVQRQRPRGLADAFVMLFVALVAGWLLVVWAVVKRPILSIPVAVYVGLVVWLGAHDAQALALYVVIALGVWRVAHKRSFQQLVGGPLRCWWRRLWVYERRWRSTLVLCGLGKRYRLRESVPRIRRVDSNRWRDRVQIRLVAGQCTEDVERVSDELAHSFGAQACRVREHLPGRLWLDFRTRDPLVELVPALPVAETVDLMAVPVGLQEDGDPWLVRVLGMHLLLAGVMGSGKSSVLWSLLRGLGPAIRDGLVAVWAADPKGGMELGLGAPLFTRFCGGEFEAMADLLDDAVEVMKDRARRLAGVTRLHEPTRAEPLILVVVDEVATLTAYQPDRKLRARIEQSLGLLLTQGRAVGVSVVAALQDPRKEVLGFRNLFPARVACSWMSPRRSTWCWVRARAIRARCATRSPTPRAASATCASTVSAKPTRVRAAYVTDQDIKAMVQLYAPRPSPGARLRAVLEGHAAEDRRLTVEQQGEVDAIKAAWREQEESS
jgi:S-DNA-T family DNA segregation ATPase FtsK/SpoIIIE